MEFTDKQAWKYIFAAFYSNNNVDYDTIVRLMDEHFEYLEQRGHIGIPLLHEAAHQGNYLGSNFILMAAWNSDKWRPLFNDPNYLNLHAEPVWYKIRPQPARIHHQSTPDTNEIRHQIKIAFYDKLSPEEVHKYLYWFVEHSDFDAVDYMKISELMEKHFAYLRSKMPPGPWPLLHRAAGRNDQLGADLVLMAAWKSDNWKPMFDSPDYLGGSYYHNEPVWRCVKEPRMVYDLLGASEIRSEIINAFEPRRKEIIQKQLLSYDKSLRINKDIYYLFGWIGMYSVIQTY